jgi:hypothetical protein
MAVIELRQRQDLTDRRAAEAYKNFNDMVQALRKKDLPEKITELANLKIEEVNRSMLNGKELTRLVKTNQKELIKVLEKEVKIVPRNYYRMLWLAVGMSAFGLPLGAAIGLATKNMGMLGIGLPIGMAIGIAVGSGMDKKAADEGRQLDFEAKP